MPEARSESTKHASLYRMVTDEHVCPYGLKAKDLLEREGFEVEDHLLESRTDANYFKRAHQVDTTPQTFIDDQRIGGYEDLREYLGKDTKGDSDTSYQPVVAIFSVAALAALAMSWAAFGDLVTVRAAEWFVSISMVLLGLQKLQDIESFSTMFLNYDLVARRWIPYGYIYPFAETLAGILMIAGALTWLSAPLALTIGLIGAVSVFKAVYVDKRELKCACVGGSSNVPLGFVSLTENLFMIAMAIWMAVKAWT